MPPNIQYANNIGVGVFVDDGGATATYLNTILARMREIQNLARATSVSIRVYQGGGGGGVGDAETARVTARRKTTQAVVAEDKRQLSLLDRIEEEQAHQRVTRERGTLAQSYAYHEEWTQKRLAQIRNLTNEELRSRAILAGGRSPELEAELARRRAATGGIVTTEAERTFLERRSRTRAGAVTEQGPTTFGLADIEAAREEQARRSAIRIRYQRGRERGGIVDELRGEEIEAEAQQRLRRQELNQRINDRAARITAEREAAERAQAAEMARRTRGAEAAATARGYRTPEEQGEFEAQNRRQYESDRAVLRRQLATARQRREDEERQAQFRGEQEQRAREQAADAPRRAAREAERRRAAEQEADVRTFQEPRARPTFRGTERDILQAAQAANTLSANLNRIASNRNVAPNIRQQAQTMRASLQQAAQQATVLNQQLHAPQGQRPPYSQVLQNLQQLQSQLHQTRVQAAALNNQVLNQPGGPGGPGGGGPGGGPGGGGGGRSLYQRGFFGFGGGGGLGSITASILTRDLIRGAIRDTERFVQVSLQAAAAEQEASNELALTANNSGRLAQENLRLAESVHRQYGITRTLAEEAVSGTQEFAQRAGRTALTPQLLQALQDIGAAKGVTAKQLPQFIQQAQNEQGRFAERYLGQRISSVYEDYARENRDKLSAGLRDTQATLPQLVASLTDFEREQALVNAILRESAKYHGAAAQRANTVAGNMDRLGSTVNDIEVSFGRFLQTNRTILTLLDRVAVVLKKIAGEGPEGLPITGPGGVILSRQDIAARGIQAGQNDRFSRNIDRVTAILSVGVVPILSAAGAIVGFVQNEKVGQVKERVQTPFQNFGDLITGGPATRAAEEEGRQQAQRERNQQIQELARANRLVYTGGPVNLGAGTGYRIKTEAEAAKELDEQLARTNQTERERDVEEKRAAEEAQVREREREQYLERVRGALQRLREIEEQGGQTVERVAQIRAGTDNQYVRTLSELESVQTRMQAQWGALGQGAVGLFTTLETQSLKAQLAVQRVNSLTEAIRLQTQAAKERDQLELGTDLTRGEQARADTVRLQVDALRKIPEMEARLGQITGVGRTRGVTQRAQDFIGDIYNQFGGPGAGIGPGGRAEKGIINQAVLDMLSEFPTAVIRNTPAFRAAYISAIEGQIVEARQGVADAIGRERLIGRENERLIATAVRFEDERQRALGGAGSEIERRAIGRAFDRALVQQTEGVSPRELAQMGLFNVRNEAIQREAERSLRDEAEARQAVQEGLQVQKGILYATTLIAQSLASGDMSLLVQVENNTRATIDAERLKRAGEALVGENQIGPRAVTNVSNVNPYQGLNDRYGRPGRE